MFTDFFFALVPKLSFALRTKGLDLNDAEILRLYRNTNISQLLYEYVRDYAPAEYDWSLYAAIKMNEPYGKEINQNDFDLLFEIFRKLLLLNYPQFLRTQIQYNRNT